MSGISTARMISRSDSDAAKGDVIWVPAKSLWTASLTLIALFLGPLTFTWDAFLLFLATCAVTLCAGHSVGMHRLLIHRSFVAPVWLERLLVYLGTLVGMAGPFGMIAAHDIRDWAQRQRQCHDLYAHRRPFFVDAWWQMHCAVKLDQPPQFVVEPETRNDPFYRFLELTWMLQQLPWAILFFALGGLPWLVWGIAVRISVSLTGHWLIGHLAHRRGHQGWAVDGVAVQGYNIKYVGLLTFGECWHGNHHAFPGSARLGVEHGQTDPGWWLISILKWLGLAREVKQPEDLVPREGLRRMESGDGGAAPESVSGRGQIAGMISIAVSTTVFCIGLAFGLRNAAALSVAPGVFIVASMQHMFIAAPAYLLVTRLWGPVAHSPFWSFALWGAGLAAIPWWLLVGSDFGMLSPLIALSGAAGAVSFGALLKPCRRTFCATRKFGLS